MPLILLRLISCFYKIVDTTMNLCSLGIPNVSPEANLNMNHKPKEHGYFRRCSTMLRHSQHNIIDILFALGNIRASRYVLTKSAQCR